MTTTDPALRRARWLPTTERIMLAGIQSIVVLAIIICVTVLGLAEALDAAAITGILGAVVGAVGTIAATGAAEHRRERRNGATAAEDGSLP